MALRKESLKIIEDAIKLGGAIQFKYYPNITIPILIYGERNVLPIKLFRIGKKFYLFAYYLNGSSASKAGAGYRLYFQKFIYDVKKTKVRMLLSNVQMIKAFSNVALTKCILKNKID